MSLPNKEENPVASMLYDIAGDWVKDGSYEERVDLLLVTAAQVLKDIGNYLDSKDVEKLAPLFRLLNTYADEDLLRFLPTDNGVYRQAVCGEYR